MEGNASLELLLVDFCLHIPKDICVDTDRIRVGNDDDPIQWSLLQQALYFMGC